MKALKDGAVYIERDPNIFANLLKHMRTNMTYMPEKEEERKVLNNELEFWGLSIEARIPQTNLFNSPSQKLKIENLWKTFPKINEGKHMARLSLEKWRELEHLTLQDIVNMSCEPI